MILPHERIADIRMRLDRDGRVIAADLARDYDTSEDTIRRDLRDLAAAGFCRRVYGGALPISPASGTLAERRLVNADAKMALGRAAAALAVSGQLIVLDAGSTNLCIARALATQASLTIATNAPSIAAALEHASGIDLIMIGGSVDKRTGGTLGARALRDALVLRPDLYFIGACAVEVETGVSVFGAEEAELKRALIEASGSVATAVTDDKVGTGALFAVLPWTDLDHLIVEHETSLTRMRRPHDAGPQIHVAQPAKETP
ncbi:DeoR/GlpR family DNA-binding transcription regulator [Lichenihabitans psoromatis]|uniref:DeoR/GlpR family DNA-binding transcription regulator n=1 Tax=Lichenihabitans psoromatis TaxID=2528642 RepID=UPI00103684A9|nr:DeoR/GlpR family DNA-binding transcription regulator [Lichenihabitans psoromatis]